MTAFPKNQGRYSWSVTSFEPAESYATLEASDRTGTDLDTIEPFVKLVPGISPSSDPAKALPKGKGQVWLTLKVNGATSFSKFIDVRRPYQALYRRVSDHLPDKGYETWTYQSDIYYTLYDQFSKLLPRPVVVREHFDPGSPITDLFYQRYGKHSRWRRTNEAGGPGKLVSIIKDGVRGQQILSGWTTPIPKPPFSGPDGSLIRVPVHQFSGTLWVGGGDGDHNSPVTGIKLLTLKWVRFLDHARHCDVTTPGRDKPFCPCAELLRSPTGQCSIEIPSSPLLKSRTRG